MDGTVKLLGRCVSLSALGGALFAAPSCSSADEGMTKSSGGRAGATTSATGGAGGTGSGTGGAGGGGGTGIIVNPGDSGPVDGSGTNCASTSIKADLLPANLLFVIDRSGSMNCNLPPTTSSNDCEAKPVRVDPALPSKWEIIRDALKTALAALPGSASVGISYFSNDDTCGVQSAPNVAVKPISAAQVAALSSSLDGVTPAGGTPIVGATILGYKHLHQQLNIPGNNYLVLLTDGSESCTPADVPSLIQTQVPNALAVAIRTFTIGAPGSESSRAVLSQIAFAGGTATSSTCDRSGTKGDVGDCHFDMTRSSNLSADLGAALATITGKALSCSFDVPTGVAGLPVDLNKVNVNFTPTGGAPIPILQDNTSSCDLGADGWQYADNNTKIVLCGPSCTKVKGDPTAKIEILLGCGTVIK